MIIPHVIPIYFNVKTAHENRTNLENGEQNMMNKSINKPNTVLGATSVMQTAVELIRKNRCNGVLDLQGRHITSVQWEEIQKCILNTNWMPPIKQIDLQGSGITSDQIDSRLQSLVIL